MTSLGRRLAGLLRTVLEPATRPATRPARRRGAAQQGAAGSRPSTTAARPASGPAAATRVRDVTGDPGNVDLAYRARDDGRADPGEVVWAWVPYDEGDGRGKDRPVLVLGRRGPSLLGLMLTSKDHDRDAADEARRGRVWMDVGTGGWDSRGRPSEVRLDRLLLLEPADVRREGAALDRDLFEEVVTAARRVQRW